MWKNNNPESADVTSKLFIEKGQYIEFTYDELTELKNHFLLATNIGRTANVIVRLINQIEELEGKL